MCAVGSSTDRACIQHVRYSMYLGERLVTMPLATPVVLCMQVICAQTWRRMGPKERDEVAKGIQEQAKRVCEQG